MVGFGNPLLDGPDARFASRAKFAREKQRCQIARSEQWTTLVGVRGTVVAVETRGGLADASSIKMQVPLPETADELCAVAEGVKAEAGDIRLGTQATEREVKRLSTTGELAKYRMVHFATHGVLAGQLDGTHEPGLILTPPDQATEEDDGYLSPHVKCGASSIRLKGKRGMARANHPLGLQPQILRTRPGAGNLRR
jgi:CHAT domain-containing protein